MFAGLLGHRGFQKDVGEDGKGDTRGNDVQDRLYAFGEVRLSDGQMHGFTSLLYINYKKKQSFWQEKKAGMRKNMEVGI